MNAKRCWAARRTGVGGHTGPGRKDATGRRPLVGISILLEGSPGKRRPSRGLGGTGLAASNATRGVRQGETPFRSIGSGLIRSIWAARPHWRDPAAAPCPPVTGGDFPKRPASVVPRWGKCPQAAFARLPSRVEHKKNIPAGEFHVQGRCGIAGLRQPHRTVSQIDKNLTESAFDCRKARLKRKNVIRLLGRPPISLEQGDCGYEFGGACGGASFCGCCCCWTG